MQPSYVYTPEDLKKIGDVDLDTSIALLEKAHREMLIQHQIDRKSIQTDTNKLKKRFLELSQNKPHIMIGKKIIKISKKPFKGGEHEVIVTGITTNKHFKTDELVYTYDYKEKDTNRTLSGVVGIYKTQPELYKICY